MKGACESAPVGVMLGNVDFLLHFYFNLTAKIEDFIAKLKQFSKLDFQSKREMGAKPNVTFFYHLSKKDHIGEKYRVYV